MDIPKDIQDLVGKTSWQHSLDKTDPTLAESRRAAYTSRYKSEVRRLRAVAVAEIEKRAASVVDQSLDRLAASYRSMNRVIAGELHSLALTVRSS